LSLWWIGNVVLVAVVVPVVVVLLTVVLRSALRLSRESDDIAEHAETLAAHLGGWQEVARTRELARELRSGLMASRGVPGGSGR